MTRRISDSVRSNAALAVATLALFVALAGTGVAAVGLGAGSVNPSNLNRHELGGYVRSWVKIGANGRPVAHGGGVRVVHAPGGGTGAYAVTWTPRPTSSCTAIGSVDITLGTAGTPGYLIAGTISKLARREREDTDVQVYNAQGQPSPLPFDLELLCSTPR